MAQVEKQANHLSKEQPYLVAQRIRHILNRQARREKLGWSVTGAVRIDFRRLWERRVASLGRH